MRHASNDLPSPDAACAVMNRLILACEEDILVHGAAARTVKDLFARDLFVERTRRRALFVEELSTLIVALAGTPRAGEAEFGQRAGLVRRSLALFRGFLNVFHDGHAYDACIRIEAETERVYNQVLHCRLPAEARTVIARQHLEVADDRAKLRRQPFLR
jgi:uncharacterized protein (TIGR02284 family)